MAAALQLDLLAAVAEEVARPAREEWMARFERAPWTPLHAAHDPALTGQIGWKCPGCGQVELNEYLLDLNHGYDPTIVGRMAGAIENFGKRCTRQILLASQERARQQREARGA